jgi:hypothetical protein
MIVSDLFFRDDDQPNDIDDDEGEENAVTRFAINSSRS